MKGILLLFVEPYIAGTRDSEKYGFPNLDKVSVTINRSPNMLYNNGIESEDAWRQASRFFMKEKHNHSIWLCRITTPEISSSF